MRISDWSSDVCSSDLTVEFLGVPLSIFSADGWRHIALPAVNLAIANIALVLRMTATGVSEAQSQDYVRFARAKGVKPGRIVRRHILRNILIPVVTVQIGRASCRERVCQYV